MIFRATALALQRLVTPQFRAILWKSLGGTLVLLILLWFFIREAFFEFVWPWLGNFLPALPDWVGWAGFIAALVFSLGLAAVMALLIAPITALIGSFFIDDAAEIIEKEDYSADPPGKAMPFGRAMVIASRFMVLSIIGNLIALVLLLVPGVNLIAFFVINGYLLGREYFEFAAARLRPEEQARAFYRQNAATVFLAGMVIALVLSVPIINLATPIFAAALMTHLHKFLSAKNVK